jgi:hypothetical protein
LCSVRARSKALALQGNHRTGTIGSVNYNDWMRALRYASLLALGVWIGGLFVIGAIAAPSAFDVAAARNVSDGRTVAGAMVGEALRRFHLVGYGCAALMILSLAGRAILGPRPRRFVVRLVVTAGMLAATAYSGLVVAARIEEARRAVATAPAGATDAPRALFARLHGLSTALHVIPLLGGLVLLAWEMQD